MDHKARLAELLKMNGDLYNLEDIVDMISDGRLQSFPHEDGSWIVTRVCEFPRKRVLEIVVAMGNLETIKSMEHSVRDFARLHGCAMLMTSAGRSGWEGEMTPGWRRIGTTFLAEI
jgi:Mg2+/Co2+ transporter CorC